MWYVNAMHNVRPIHGPSRLGVAETKRSRLTVTIAIEIASESLATS